MSTDSQTAPETSFTSKIKQQGSLITKRYVQPCHAVHIPVHAFVLHNCNFHHRTIPASKKKTSFRVSISAMNSTYPNKLDSYVRLTRSRLLQRILLLGESKMPRAPGPGNYLGP